MGNETIRYDEGESRQDLLYAIHFPELILPIKQTKSTSTMHHELKRTGVSTSEVLFYLRRRPALRAQRKMVQGAAQQSGGTVEPRKQSAKAPKGAT